jgi:hypothetical protein
LPERSLILKGGVRERLASGRLTHRRFARRRFATGKFGDRMFARPLIVSGRFVKVG